MGEKRVRASLILAAFAVPWALAGCVGGSSIEASPIEVLGTTAVTDGLSPTTLPPTSAVPTTSAPTSLTPTTPVATTHLFDVLASDERVLEPVAHITGELAAKSVVASGHGLFFAQNMMYRHTISVFDASHELVATIPDTVDLAAFGVDAPTGPHQGSPVEAAFSPDGRYAYVSNYRMYGPGFTQDPGDSCNIDQGEPSFVYRIDTATLAIDQVIPVGIVPKYVAVTPDGGRLLVTNWCSFDMTIVDLASGTTEAVIDLGRHPRGIAVTSDSAAAYATVMGSSDIARIDLSRLPDGAAAVGWLRGVGASPRHIVLSPDDRLLYATLNGEGTVVKIDLSVGEVVDRVRTGAAPRSMALAADGRSIYVVNYESDTMTKVRAADFEILQTFDTADKPIGITSDPLTGEVWVSAYSGVIHVLAEIEPTTG